jgi:hypothetical protein
VNLEDTSERVEINESNQAINIIPAPTNDLVNQVNTVGSSIRLDGNTVQTQNKNLNSSSDINQPIDTGDLSGQDQDNQRISNPNMELSSSNVEEGALPYQ